jgi:hypothetical protein
MSQIREMELTGEFILDQEAFKIQGFLVLKIRDQDVGELFIYFKKEFNSSFSSGLQCEEEIAIQIKQFEQELQREIVERNSSLMYNDHLKHLRRQLPISKTKIDWEKASFPLVINKK